MSSIIKVRRNTAIDIKFMPVMRNEEKNLFVKFFNGLNFDLFKIYDSNDGDSVNTIKNQCFNKKQCLFLIETENGRRFGFYSSLRLFEVNSSSENKCKKNSNNNSNTLTSNNSITNSSININSNKNNTPNLNILSNSQYATDDDFAFIFSLDFKRQFPITNKKYVISYGIDNIMIGSGPDIFISEGFNSNSKSYTNIQGSYGEGEKLDEGYSRNNYLSGEEYFKIKRLEIHQVYFK